VECDGFCTHHAPNAVYDLMQVVEGRLRLGVRP